MTFASLPAFVTDALQTLRSAGYEAYLVGGCVRDILLGTGPHDFDLTTSALPEEVRSVFARRKTVDTGIKHGTVTVLYDGEPLEITTFRTESGYSDNRHPDAVAFSRSLESDLCRRDFTVYAMAWAPKTGLVDLYGGREDLKNGLIRCVGDPETRFREDALRILRAVRFSSTLGFAVEEATSKAVHGLRELLHNVSSERVCAELKTLLCGKDAERVLTDYRDLFAVVLPELAPCFDFPQRSKYHVYDVYTHTVKVVAGVKPDPVMRLAALLHDTGKPFSCQTEGETMHFKGHPEKSAAFAEKALRRLHAERTTIDRVCTLIRCHDDYEASEREEQLRLLAYLSPEQVEDLLDLMIADALAKSELGHSHAARLREGKVGLHRLLEERIPLRVGDLAVDGDDLIALGYPAGKEIGKCLLDLLSRVQKGEFPNKKADLLTFLQGNRIDSPFIS